MYSILDTTNYRLIVLAVGGFTIDRDRLLPRAPLEAILAEGWDPQAIPMRLAPLLLVSGREVVLVDPSPLEGDLMGGLARAGYSAEDVTAVVFTHLHGDHHQGSLVEGKPAFPYARYFISQEEWDYWHHPAEAEIQHFKDTFRWDILPAEKLLTIYPSGETILPGIRSLPAPGHTPGSVALVIDEQVLVVGDVYTNHLQIGHPEWGPAFDADDEAAHATRRNLSRLAEEKNMWVYGMHFPAPGVGRLVRDEEARLVWQKKEG